MKIAIDIRNIGKKRTGDETVFFNLTHELAKIDTENEYFLCIDERPAEELEGIQNRLGIGEKKNFSICPLGSGNKFLWNAFLVPRFVRKEKIDVYHTQYVTPFFVPRKTRIVTHMHDVSFCVFPEAIGKLDLFFLRILIPLAMRRANAIVAVSEFTKGEVGRFYGAKAEKKTYVIQNGIERFSSESIFTETCARVRKAYHLPEKFFLNVGTLQPRKNIPFLLRAFDACADRVQDVSLVLTGNRSGHNADGAIATTLQTMRHSDRIIFTGYIENEDLPALYALSLAAVFPSRYEGFGLPVGEALLAGTFALVSDIPPHREVGGEYAQYFDAGDIAKLSQLLYDSSIAEKNVSSRDALDSTLPRWSVAAQKIRDLYRSL